MFVFILFFLILYYDVMFVTDKQVQHGERVWKVFSTGSNILISAYYKYHNLQTLNVRFA